MTQPHAVPFDFDEYNYMVPADLEQAQPLFQLISKYMDLYDQATQRWRERATVADKTETNGVLLGIGDRCRKALRACQLLACHRLYKDSAQVIRPIAEAAIYLQYMCKDGDEQLKQRTERFAKFQSVERKRNLEHIRAMDRVKDMHPEKVAEIEENFAADADEFDGDLFFKSPFDVSLRRLARDSEMEFVYRTAFNHASSFSHITVASIGELRDLDLGLGLGACIFPVVFRILDDALKLGAEAQLKALEEETNAVCRALTPGANDAA